jgi:hypothetical protein
MNISIEKWEAALRTDPALEERLRRLNAAGSPATMRGDLLCLKAGNAAPLVVGWDGSEIRVAQREAKKPFCSWTMTDDAFNRLFRGSCPPLLVAMNNDQASIRMGSDHHNGALVVSFMVMLQEVMEGGVNR